MDPASASQRPTPEQALQDFRKQIEVLTLKAVDDRQFVQVAKLQEWLSSAEPATKEPQLQRLLYACMPSASSDELRRPSLNPDHVLKSKRSIILLGTLCMIGHHQYFEQLWTRQSLRKHLPEGIGQLKVEFEQAKIPDADNVAQAFFEMQWRFSPVVFRLHEDSQLGPHHILPIMRQKLINSKSDMAELVQVEILEEFVDEPLQERVPLSRYDHNDGLGGRFQFALKTFHGEKLRHHFDREKNNFNSLRDHDRMVSCLNTFHKQIAYQIPQDKELSQSGPLTSTFNFLLEYGDRDLDTYFVQVVPPFLEPEIVGFWKELFEIVEAVAEIHNYRNPDEGRQDDQYKGFHADIKPDNILLVENKCKLADFGYTKFVHETGSITEAYLAGATYTYSAPEHLPGKTEKVGQSVDIWSLGCVFSIAATWILGGYASIRDYTRVREKAIQRIKEEQPSQRKFLADGNLFCDGTRVLEDVTRWHQALRMSVRQSDKITEHVLDIIDNDIFLEDPSKRISCEGLRRKLADIIKNSPIDPQKQLPQSILTALQDINDEAPAVPSHTSTSTSTQPTTDSTGTAPERKGNKALIMNTPLRKTAYREEYLKSVLGDRSQRPITTSGQTDLPTNVGLSENDQDSNKAAVVPSPFQIIQPHPQQKTIVDSRLRTYHSRDRHSAPHSHLGVHDVFHLIEKQGTNILGMRGKLKPLKSEILSSYCKRFDFQFLIDNGWSMREHWSFAAFALHNLSLMASLLDDDGMDLFFTRHGNDIPKKRSGAILTQAMWKRSNMPKKGIQTDMHKALNRVFHQYLTKLNEQKNPNPKQLLLIVLTDGVWSKETNMDDIRDTIVAFLSRLKRDLRFIERPFCIQFVQFGHNPAAVDRLRFLDDRVCRDAGLVDSIDTENVLGDVHKMFLGSHVAEYDLLAHSPSLSPHPTPSSNENAMHSVPDITI